MSTHRRRRHRARRDDPARRGRRVHLGRHARRPLRGRSAHPGVGRAAARTHRRPARRRAAEVIDRVKLRRLDRSEAIALIAARAGLGRRRPGRRRPRPRAARRQRRHRHRRARRPCSPRTTSWRPPARAGSRRTPCRCSCPTARPPGSASSSARRPACTRWPAPAPPAPRRSRSGLDIIRSGRADVVVAGGTEAVIHPLPIAGFASMRAMSTRNDEPEKASRPWDKGRDGFVLGEGAGVVVLERADHAAARGATDLRPAGRRRHHLRRLRHRAAAPARARAAIRAIAQALARRRRSPSTDIVHVNAHATSTPVGDMAEIVGAARGARRPPGAHRDQVDDRAPARRGRRAGVDRHDPGDPRRRRPADDQPRRPRRRARPGRGRAQGPPAATSRRR